MEVRWLFLISTSTQEIGLLLFLEGGAAEWRRIASLGSGPLQFELISDYLGPQPKCTRNGIYLTRIISPSCPICSQTDVVFGTALSTPICGLSRTGSSFTQHTYHRKSLSCRPTLFDPS